VASRLDYANTLYCTARRPATLIGCRFSPPDTELTGSDSASGPSFCQCNRITSAASVVANSPTVRLQASSHHLLTRRDPSASRLTCLNSSMTTNQHAHYDRQIVNLCTEDVSSRCRRKHSALSLLQSGTPCHIAVDPPSFSVLLSVL